jgi:hypothetical protein
LERYVEFRNKTFERNNDKEPFFVMEKWTPTSESLNKMVFNFWPCSCTRPNSEAVTVIQVRIVS